MNAGFCIGVWSVGGEDLQNFSRVDLKYLCPDFMVMNYKFL